MISIRRQSGSILLTLMLVIIVTASFTLVSKLNASSRSFIRRQATMEVLQQAKAALIAYAVTYPERSGDPTAGPGILPCPASDDNGVAVSNCSYSGTTTLAKLPWTTLDTGKLRDDAGELLWYAVTDNYRTPLPLGVVNDDVPGLITVGGADDIVAVIIAPGAPTNTQGNRGPNNITVNQYLEGVGVNTMGTDYSFTSSATDVLVYITRQELMRAVEKRVSSDVVNALKNYQVDTGVFPWLTVFDPNPATTDYDAVVNTREGGLAFNDINEVFPTQFSVSWDIRAGGDGAPFTMTPKATMSDWNSFPAISLDKATPFSVTGSPECTWTVKEEFICNGRYEDPDPISDGGTPFEKWGVRTYDFIINLPAGGTVSTGVNPVRIRNDTVSAPFPVGTSVTVQITDTYNKRCQVVTGNCYPITPEIVDSQTNTITTATDADIIVTNVTYDLGVGDEIPQWLVANNWEKYIYVAYSATDVPGTTPPCVQGTNCLTLLNSGPNMNNKQAIIVMAGPALASQNRGATYAENEYFESENDNSTPDDVFERNVLKATFNDQARVVAP